MLDFVIKPDGGEPFELTAGPRDILAWERATKGTFAVLLSNRSFGAYYRIAHHAARRLGMFDGDLAEFERTCDVEFPEGKEGADDEPDPTQPAP
jgi:hypothetical protein